MNNKPAKLDHINFTVSDFEAAVSWYQKIFNFELVEKGLSQNQKRWGILRSGDSMLAISEDSNRKIDHTENFHRVYHFGLRLTDKEEWEKTLSENNLETFYSSPVNYPYSTSWYVKDPTGNEIEVAIWKGDCVRFEDEV